MIQPQDREQLACTDLTSGQVVAESRFRRTTRRTIVAAENAAREDPMRVAGDQSGALALSTMMRSTCAPATRAISLH